MLFRDASLPDLACPFEFLCFLHSPCFQFFFHLFLHFLHVVSLWPWASCLCVCQYIFRTWCLRRPGFGWRSATCILSSNRNKLHRPRSPSCLFSTKLVSPFYAFLTSPFGPIQKELAFWRSVVSRDLQGNLTTRARPEIDCLQSNKSRFPLALSG